MTKKRDIRNDYFVRSNIEEGPRLVKVTLQVVHVETDTVLLEIVRLVNNRNQALGYEIALRRMLFKEGRIYRVMLNFLAKDFDVDIEGKSDKEAWQIIRPILIDFNEKALKGELVNG